MILCLSFIYLFYFFLFYSFLLIRRQKDEKTGVCIYTNSWPPPLLWSNWTFLHCLLIRICVPEVCEQQGVQPNRIFFVNKTNITIYQKLNFLFTGKYLIWSKCPFLLPRCFHTFRFNFTFLILSPFGFLFGEIHPCRTGLMGSRFERWNSHT